jgi:hypothetical protein
MKSKGLAQQVVVAQRRQRAVELRIKGWSLARIAEELGYKGENTDIAVGKDVQRALKAAAEARNDTVETYRETEIARLDLLIKKATEILERNHYVWRDGEWLALEGERVIDDAVALQAIDRLERLSQSRRRLLGLDAPTQFETKNVHLFIEGVDMENLS